MKPGRFDEQPIPLTTTTGAASTPTVQRRLQRGRSGKVAAARPIRMDLALVGVLGQFGGRYDGSGFNDLGSYLFLKTWIRVRTEKPVLPASCPSRR